MCRSQLPWLKKPRQRKVEFEDTSCFFLQVLVEPDITSVERDVFALL
jgi:hypothetical protein